MSTNSWEWAGARWWKLDFHTHTPASNDYGSGLDREILSQETPRKWLLDYMRAGIDCVAVTDHNTGAWVDRLREELATLDDERPEGYRPMVLFPGVEISVNGGVHLLAILSPEKTRADIDSLLGAVRFRGTKGLSSAVTEASLSEVVSEIKQAGGLAIPAHVDGPSGLFKEQDGTTLGQALDCSSIVAMEVVDSNADKPPQYVDKNCNWTEVLGSDAHHPSGDDGQRYPGSRYTWVKMGSPNLEGLRLALLDGSMSVKRSDETTGDPNEHAAIVLETIEVSKARYMGRSEPLTIKLNPWLNTIIGGRGTGKSTLVEFLRVVSRRDGEIPDALADDLSKYKEVYSSRDDDGLLTDDAELAAVFRKDGARFKVQWNPGGDVEPILEDGGGEAWSPGTGEIPERFPIRIFSQKQIYQLAKAPGALLRVIDQAPEVQRRDRDEQWRAEESRFLSLRAKARELEVGLSDEPRLRGELADIERRLELFERSGHADVLRAYQRRRRQQRVVEEWQESWQDAGERIRTVARGLVPDPLDETRFVREADADVALLQQSEETRERLTRLRREVETLAGQADSLMDDWKTSLAESPWQRRVEAAAEAYNELKERLAEEEVGDPTAYGELVQQRQLVEGQLKQLAERAEQVKQIRDQAARSLERLDELRRDLTSARREFLRGVLADNEYVRITVRPYCAEETVESELRRILAREGGGFEKDIGSPGGEGLLGRLYEADREATELTQRLASIKREVRATAADEPGGLGVHDQRFATHLQRLSPEVLDRFDVWFPEDSLDVEYSASGDGRGFRSIQEGSPGQKTAALLAFLLSYGEEPLVLDQPEDDLDNHLIYELIVAQLRNVKARRQLIVVTHNPNIVVNGDAELVIALEPHGGRTQVGSHGSLQERSVRKTICNVVEGGREAFERRYRRIALEDGHV